MSELKPYPLRVAPLLGESLRSYMHRFAMRNKVPYINWITTDLDLRNIFTALTSSQIERLSAISGIGVDTLSNRQAAQVDGETVFRGQQVALTMVEREASRLCVQCFQENPFHRLDWDFMPLSVCAVHGIPLTRHCPECGIVLHWRRNCLTKCPAGHSLLKVTADARAVTNDTVLSCVRLISDWMADGPDTTVAELPWSKAELPLRDLIEMLELLSSLTGEDVSIVRGGTRHVYEVGDYHLVLARGYEVILDWPRNLHRALDQRCAADGAQWLADISAPARRLLHGQLSRQKRPYRRILGEEIWNYAQQKGITLSPGAFGFAPADFNRTFISSTAARSLMQVSTEVLRRIACKESWLGSTQLATGKFAWFRLSDVEGWCIKHKSRLSPTKLACRFHTSQTTILEMARLGLFGPKACNRHPAQRRVRWHALPIEAARFMDELRGALTTESEGHADYITWNGFTKRPESRSLRFFDVIAGVIRRKIRAIALDGENLASLRFNLNDALALRQSDLPDSPVAAIGEIALPLRKIKERFHIEHPFVMRAIELGLLPAAERCHGNARFWVTPTDMEAFLARFTTIGLLARQLGKSAPSLWGALRRLGVDPYDAETSPRSAKLFSWKAIHATGLDRIAAACRDEKPRKSDHSGSVQKACDSLFQACIAG